MPDPSIRPSGALRTRVEDATGSDGGDNAVGFQPALSGDRGGPLRPSVSRLGGLVQSADDKDQGSGSLSRRGQHASGAGRSHGGAVGTPCGRDHPGGPDFSQAVPKGGYVWWYVDGISDDGNHALTIIAFIGSVFSPYYALARRFGRGDPHNHCALNVALYGCSAKHWALTERTREDLRRDARSLQIGPSRLDWDGDGLVVHVDEITVPWPSRLKGVVRVRPAALTRCVFDLDGEGRHQWHPVAPCAEIEVVMERPRLSWRGHGYLDCNFGDEPLEAAFVEWDWTRAQIGSRTAVLYDTFPRHGPPVSLALRFDPNGRVEEFAAPPRADLPSTIWRIARHARSDDRTPHLIKTLEDTPFYARSLVAAQIAGEQTLGVHESLSLDRVANPIVRAMLPFRMPRRRWRRS